MGDLRTSHRPHPKKMDKPKSTLIFPNLLNTLYHIYTFVLVHCQLHEHLYASLSMRMNCLHMCTNIHMFVQVNVNEQFSLFVPFDSCSKTVSRASATNGEVNDAKNDKVNMWLVHSSFASPLTWMCKYGIRCTVRHRCLTPCVLKSDISKIFGKF